jgi:hypothetical protein
MARVHKSSAKRDALDAMALDGISGVDLTDSMACKSCGGTKPRHEFFRPGQTPRGMRTVCTACRDAPKVRAAARAEWEASQKLEYAAYLARLAEQRRRIAAGESSIVLAGWALVKKGDNGLPT